MLEGNWVDVLVEDERERKREVEHREALGAQCERQDLDSVRHDERRERKAAHTQSVSPHPTGHHTEETSTHS